MINPFQHRGIHPSLAILHPIFTKQIVGFLNHCQIQKSVGR